jgi:hypothetical protein
MAVAARRNNAPGPSATGAGQRSGPSTGGPPVKVAPKPGNFAGIMQNSDSEDEDEIGAQGGKVVRRSSFRSMRAD